MGISVLIVEVSPSASWSPIYFTTRPHRIFMGPSKCSLAINFVIFQLEFHLLREVTKLGVILLNFVDIGKNLRQLRLAAFKKKKKRYIKAILLKLNAINRDLSF